MKTLIELICDFQAEEERASTLAGKHSPASYNTAWLEGKAHAYRQVIQELEAFRQELGSNS